jgi:Tfp pilus assembly PilM family ATPase
VQVRSAFAHDWPAELGASKDPAAVGMWLNSQLPELDAHDQRLIVLVSREEIATRLLMLPEANNDALPDLVRHQVAARSSVPLDQLAFDYAPLVATPPQGGRWVQTASVPQRLLQRIKTFAEVAELDLRSVGMTTIACGEAIARAERSRNLPSDRKQLVVCFVGEQLEVSMWRGVDLLFSHVARASDSKTVVAEVQRSLMSHDTVVGKDAISRTWLIAPLEREAELRTVLTTRLSCDVVGFEPSREVLVTGLTADSGEYVASLGALLAETRRTVLAFDFLNPRRRELKPDRTKMIAAVAVGVLLLLVTTAYAASRLYLSSLEDRIAEKETAIREQERLLKESEPTLATIKMLSSWHDRRVDWLEQLQQIAAEMPGTDRVYLTDWRFDLATGEALGSTTATGFAREREDAQRLTQRLAEQPGIRIRPNPIGSGGSDPEYPILLQLDAELLPPTERPVRNESK